MISVMHRYLQFGCRYPMRISMLYFVIRHPSTLPRLMGRLGLRLRRQAVRSLANNHDMPVYVRLQHGIGIKRTAIRREMSANFGNRLQHIA